MAIAHIPDIQKKKKSCDNVLTVIQSDTLTLQQMLLARVGCTGAKATNRIQPSPISALSYQCRLEDQWSPWQQCQICNYTLLQQLDWHVIEL